MIRRDRSQIQIINIYKNIECLDIKLKMLISELAIF